MENEDNVLETLHKLKEVILSDNPKIDKDFGLCKVLYDMVMHDIIDARSMIECEDYIDANMPQDCIIVGWPNAGVYGWPLGDMEVRVEWIDEQIEILSQ